jgi:hypothetical protein
MQYCNHTGQDHIFKATQGFVLTTVTICRHLSKSVVTVCAYELCHRSPHSPSPVAEFGTVYPLALEQTT